MTSIAAAQPTPAAPANVSRHGHKPHAHKPSGHKILKDSYLLSRAMPAYTPLDPGAKADALKRSPDTTYVQRAIQGANGDRHEPVTMVMTGTEAEVAHALEKAGWYRADEVNAVSGVKSIADVAGDLPSLQKYHLSYPQAPVSDQFLDGKRHDMAFEKNNDHNLVRDHLRVFDTGRRDAEGRPIWDVAATRDVGVDINVKNKKTDHKVDPNIDPERDQVMADLLKSGEVQDWAIAKGQLRAEDRAAVQQHFKTDSQVYMLDLASHPDLTEQKAPESKLGKLVDRAPKPVQTGLSNLNQSLTRFFKKISG